MLDTIMKWVANMAAELMSWAVKNFLGLLSFDLDSLVSEFPLLWTGYRIFQSIGIGLVLAIMTLQIAKFFMGPLAESRDTPARLLFRGVIAIIMIFVGNYFVEILIDISKIPFDKIVTDISGTKWGVGFFQSFTTGFNKDDIPGINGAVMLLDIILVIMIGINLLKLALEIAERFLMVGVLAYTSPLAFSTLASQSTSSIFSKWFSMLFGQCLLMTISAWMLQLCISGFAFTKADGKPSWYVFLMTLGLCKIAQRTDSYLQQLGIGVATTGGSMVDEIMGVSRSLAFAGVMGGRGRAAQSGANAGSGAGDGKWGMLSKPMNMATAPITTPIKFASGFVKGGINSLRNGGGGVGSLKDAAVEGLKTAGIPTDGYKAMTGQGFAGNVAGVAYNGARALRGFYGWARPTGAGIRHIENPAAVARRASEQTASFAKKTAPGTPYAAAARRAQAQGAGYDNTAKLVDGTPMGIKAEAQTSGQATNKFFDGQLAANGPGSFEMETAKMQSIDGTETDIPSVRLSDKGFAGGARFFDNPEITAAQTRNEQRQQAYEEALARGETDVKPPQLEEVPATPFIEGTDDHAGVFMAYNADVVMENLQKGGPEAVAWQRAQNTLVKSAGQRSPLTAETMMFDTDATMKNNDPVYDAMLKNAIGEEAITQQTGGQFKNIRVETIEGQRVAHADYQSKTGQMAHYDISLEQQMPGVSDGVFDQTWSTSTRETQRQIFVHKSKYQERPKSGETPPVTKRKLFGRKNKDK